MQPTHGTLRHANRRREQGVATAQRGPPDGQRHLDVSATTELLPGVAPFEIITDAEAIDGGRWRFRLPPSRR
jgi:hypothetical protein